MNNFVPLPIKTPAACTKKTDGGGFKMRYFPSGLATSASYCARVMSQW